jgi:hypothetical protein
MTGSDDSLGTVIEQQRKCKFRSAAMLLFYIVNKVASTII